MEGTVVSSDIIDNGVRPTILYERGLGVANSIGLDLAWRFANHAVTRKQE
jgi:hypothetical protein